VGFVQNAGRSRIHLRQCRAARSLKRSLARQLRLEVRLSRLDVPLLVLSSLHLFLVILAGLQQRRQS
jgi:hypothetical protein